MIARDAANANAIFKCAQGVNKRTEERGTFQDQLNSVLPLFKQTRVSSTNRSIQETGNVYRFQSAIIQRVGKYNAKNRLIIHSTLK